MSYGLVLVGRKLALPILAVALGAQLGGPLVMVQDATCESFEGGLSGNDPDAAATLVLCRSDDRLYGRLRVEGSSGVSVGELIGEVGADGHVVLADTGPLVDEPRPGWMFCFDDVFDLTWDPLAQRLAGTYRSEQCDDTGTIVVIPRR
jgi:hypothetical protein